MITISWLLIEGARAGTRSTGDDPDIWRGSPSNGLHAVGVVPDFTPAWKYPLIETDVWKTFGCRAMLAAEQYPPCEKPSGLRASGVAMLRRSEATHLTPSLA